MRIGCCVTPTRQDLEVLVAAGYDYVEPAIGRVMSMPEVERAATIDTLASGILPVEVFNVFFPRDFHIVGGDGAVTPDSLVASYVSEALDLMAMVGAHIVVFGSGAARRIPEGFDRATALRQLHDFLWYFGEEASRRGIQIVLEPLNRAETNALNSVAEAESLAGEVGHAAIGVLADIYHMAKDNEPFSQVAVAGERLWHAHVSALDRTAPTKDGEALEEFFRSLRQANYSGNVSIECRWDDFASQAKPALEFVRRCMA